MNKQIWAIVLMIGILFSGCGNDNSKQNDANSSKSDVTVQQPKLFVEYVSGLPDKISKLPSIGSTRAEFGKSYNETGQYLEARIGYNRDNFLADFLDGGGEFSKNQKARAFIFNIQALPHNRLADINIEDYLPSDAYDVERSYDTGNDEMVIVDRIVGKSDMLAKMYPKDNGDFTVTIQYDRQTNDFIAATIMAF